MSRVKKCDLDYLKIQTGSEIIKTVILFASSLAILIIGMVITKGKNPDMSWFDAKNNILTIAAVLGILPAARYLVNTIMFLKAKKHSMDHDKGMSFIEAVDPERILLRFDMYMTTEKVNFIIKSLTCADDTIIGYTEDKAFKQKEFTEHINTMLTKNGLKVNTIKIFDNADKYCERLHAINETGYVQTDKDAAVMRLMENLSL